MRSNSSSGKILSVHNIQVSKRPTWGAEVGLRRMKQKRRNPPTALKKKSLGENIRTAMRVAWSGVGRFASMAQTRRTQPSVWMAVELQVLERSGSAIASTCRRPPTSSHRSHLTDSSPCDFLFQERKGGFLPFSCAQSPSEKKRRAKKSPEILWRASSIALDSCVCVCVSVSV